VHDAEESLRQALDQQPHQPPLLPSLIDESFDAAPAAPPPRRTLRERARGWWAARTSTPAKRARTMKRVRIAGVLLLVGASVGAYFALRPRPMPDYENDPLDEIFDYTLLSDEFNRLPVEKRIELVSSIIGRLKNMGSGDSAMLAAFAAGIMGSAREQLEQNASKLAIDLWDKYADDYAKMKGEDRGAYLDKTFVEFQKTMELMGGQPRDISDEERLKEGQRQAKRDQERMSDPKRGPSARQMAQMFVFMDRQVGVHAAGNERARGAQLMRDMTRRLRGQDPVTGKPINGGG
jgi:hypothetical protein